MRLAMSKVLKKTKHAKYVGCTRQQSDPAMKWGWILRIYDSWGGATDVTTEFDLKLILTSGSYAEYAGSGQNFCLGAKVCQNSG